MEGKGGDKKGKGEEGNKMGEEGRGCGMRGGGSDGGESVLVAGRGGGGCVMQVRQLGLHGRLPGADPAGHRARGWLRRRPGTCAAAGRARAVRGRVGRRRRGGGQLRDARAALRTALDERVRGGVRSSAAARRLASLRQRDRRDQRHAARPQVTPAVYKLPQ